MALPTIIATWKQLLTTGTPGARVSFVSLLDTMQQTLFRVKDFLCNGSAATTKYSVLWTASNGTGPTNSNDHTDRWTSAATITPRGTSAGVSQAWAVLTDGNGAQILLAFQGASDDICRISFSPGALFTLAGTTNQQPTATDEQVILSTTSVVGATASGDRILQVWASDDAKMFRVAIFRAGVVVAPVWGVELFTSGMTAPAAATPCVWGFAFSDGNLAVGTTALSAAWSANARGGLVQTTVSSIKYSCQTQMAIESANLAGTYGPAPQQYTYQPELQGAGFAPYPIALHTTNQTGSRGRLGNLIDWWCVSPASVADGDGFGTSYQFIQMGSVLWPNPSAQAPTIT